MWLVYTFMNRKRFVVHPSFFGALETGGMTPLLVNRPAVRNNATDWAGWNNWDDFLFSQIDIVSRPECIPETNLSLISS